MKFTAEGSRIICRRIDNTVEDDGAFKHVVEFDAQVDSVPPHVAVRLTTGEVIALKGFIADRKRIQANSAEENVLEALPGLIEEATCALESVTGVNKSVYKRLSASTVKLSRALDYAKPASRHASELVKNMDYAEAQKVRLEKIKQDL